MEDALLPAASKGLLPQGGKYQWRRDGEQHMWDPETIAGLQSVARGGGSETYKEFSRRVDQENASFNLLRGLMRLRTDPSRSRCRRSSRWPRSSSGSPPGP